MPIEIRILYSSLIFPFKIHLLTIHKTIINTTNNTTKIIAAFIPQKNSCISLISIYYIQIKGRFNRLFLITKNRPSDFFRIFLFSQHFIAACHLRIMVKGDWFFRGIKDCPSNLESNIIFLFDLHLPPLFYSSLLKKGLLLHSESLQSKHNRKKYFSPSGSAIPFFPLTLPNNSCPTKGTWRSNSFSFLQNNVVIHDP